MSLVTDVREQLRTHAEQEGLTHAEIARRMGCTREHVTQILNGPKSPRLELLERVAAAMGCNVRFSLVRSREKISA